MGGGLWKLRSGSRCGKHLLGFPSPNTNLEGAEAQASPTLWLTLAEAPEQDSKGFLHTSPQYGGRGFYWFTLFLHIWEAGILGFLLCKYLQHNSLCEVCMSSKHTCTHYLS